MGSYAPLYLERGDTIELVRWYRIRGNDEQQHELVKGTYLSRTEGTFRVRLEDGTVRSFDRSEWTVCAS